MSYLVAPTACLQSGLPLESRDRESASGVRPIETSYEQAWWGSGVSSPCTSTSLDEVDEGLSLCILLKAISPPGEIEHTRLLHTRYLMIYLNENPA